MIWIAWPEQAEAVFAALVPQCANDDEISLVANARAYNLGVLLADRARSVEVLDEALAAVTEPKPRHRLLNRRASGDVWADRPRAALADARELMESGDDDSFVRGACIGAVALAMLGQGEEAAATSRRGRERQDAAAATSTMSSAHGVGAVLGHLGSGRLRKAELVGRLGYEANVEINAQEALATFALLRGMVLVQIGRVAEAARLYREGVAINREVRDVSSLRWCLGGLALASAMAGDASAASAAIAELDATPAHWMDALDSDPVLRGRAWTLVATGELSEARRALRDAVAIARRREQFYSEARLLHDIARLGEPGTVTKRLRELASEVEGDLVSAFAADAAARASNRGAELERSAETLERLGAIGLSAETFRAAAGAFTDGGLARAANACARKAVELAEQCGGVAAPGVAQAGAASRLTRREQEIAALAATGHSSPEIGERLHISARTVENHLASAYLKLGVTGRRELAEALSGTWATGDTAGARS